MPKKRFSCERNVMVFFVNVMFFEIFKWNGNLWVKTGTDTCRNVITKKIMSIDRREKVLLF